MKDKYLNGHISISSVQSNTEPNYISIEIGDRKSHVTIIRVKISYEDFGKVVTGRGYTDCKFELFDTKNVGKICEHKEEDIDFGDDDKSHDDDFIRQTIARYEVNGWTGRDSDAHNHHRWVGPGTHIRRITFYRFVDDVTEEDKE